MFTKATAYILLYILENLKVCKLLLTIILKVQLELDGSTQSDDDVGLLFIAKKSLSTEVICCILTTTFKSKDQDI